MSPFPYIQKQTAYYPLLIALFCFIPHLLVAAIDNRGSSSFYLKEYGALDTSHSKKVKQAYAVFDRLKQASPLSSHQKKYRLIILPQSAANWENWAMSLPDGTVVLVENLLDICFGDAQQITEKGNARLAFVLAHELSHLNDQHHSYLTHRHSLQFQNQDDQIENPNLQQIEANADYSGLILMTMAKYEPRFLMDQSNFFHEYIKTVRSNFSFKNHAVPKKRMEILKGNLQPLINELPMFASGVRYFEQQEYHKAIENFQQFASFFPGREVYNNIGLSYYQLALQDLALFDSKNLYRFMLSTKIDKRTLASNLVPGNRGEPRSVKNRFLKHLEKAESNLKLAIERDSDYLPARINLSSVLITGRKIKPALDTLQDILARSPTDIEALNNKAVALYLAAPRQNAARSVSILDTMAGNQFGSSQRFFRYNKARIQSEQLQCYASGNLTQNDDCLLLARKSWSPFLAAAPDSVYAQRIKLELGATNPATKTFVEKHRVALVIGNSSYHDAPLLNPVNDATAMRNKLTRLGFDVHLGLDLNKKQLLEIIQQFSNRLTPDSTGLVYYSGHGLQVNGENFLLPIGTATAMVGQHLSLQQKSDLIRDNAVSLKVILDRLSYANNVQNIVVLDACRDNPLTGLGDEFKGFAEMTAPPRTYIAYATSPGKIAWDGLDGGNGIFTRSLLNHIGQVDMDIHELFQEVRKDVASKTGDYQITWDVSTLDEAYSFNPAKPQDWTWHIAAGSLLLLSAWQSKQEARSYRQLSSKNDVLVQKYGDSINLAEYLDIREQYYVNQEKMRNHKRNYQILDVATVAAALWGIYLLVYETYDEGIYDSAEKPLTTTFSVQPNSQSNAYGFSLQWRW